MRAAISLLPLSLLGLLPRLADAETLALPQTLVFDAFDRERDAPPQERAANRDDGVYGRFDGELSLAPFIGAAWTYDGPLTDLGLSAYYFQTVGLTAKYGDGRLFPTSRRSHFNVSTLSLSLRPLFVLRWSKDLEQGPSWLDLTIDSLTLSVGGFWAINNNTEAVQRGLETELSLSLPLLAKADGPWLGIAAGQRYPRVTDDDHSLDLTLGLRLAWAFTLGQ